MLRRLILPALFGVAGLAVLVALGLWQLERHDWKQQVLGEIDAKLEAVPGALPALPDPETDRFLPVRAEGRIGEQEVLVQASLKGIGPGFRVIAPFETDGRRILLDRGFVPVAARDAARAAGPATVSGNLHWPDEVDGFTPDPDPAAGLWFARDLDSLAAHLDTEPVLLVVRESTVGEGLRPLPVDSAGIPDNHLSYAVQWFLLAAVWAGMSAYWLVGQRRRPQEG